MFSYFRQLLAAAIDAYLAVIPEGYGDTWMVSLDDAGLVQVIDRAPRS